MARARVAKPGQRRKVEGLVTQVFEGSNPFPRIDAFFNELSLLWQPDALPGSSGCICCDNFRYSSYTTILQTDFDTMGMKKSIRKNLLNGAPYPPFTALIPFLDNIHRKSHLDRCTVPAILCHNYYILNSCCIRCKKSALDSLIEDIILCLDYYIQTPGTSYDPIPVPTEPFDATHP